MLLYEVFSWRFHLTLVLHTMSVVRKMIDLDCLARELRKHGKVLSRCEECGRLFTDVQKAMLHRKVHSSVAILLPRTSAQSLDHKLDLSSKETSTSAAEPASDPSNGEMMCKDGKLDYSFIVQAIANANETMTFGDLERLSSEISNKNCNLHGSRQTESGADEDPYKECEASRSQFSPKALKEANHRTSRGSNVSVSVADTSKGRTCRYLLPDVNPSPTTQQSAVTGFYGSDVEGQDLMPTLPTCVQNPLAVQNENLFESNSQSCGLLDGLDFNSATLGDQTTGSLEQQQQSLTHRAGPDHLLQQIMGGSSFLQLLNEPLDESLGDFCNAQIPSSYTGHHPENQQTETNSQDYSFNLDNTETNAQGDGSCSDSRTEINSDQCISRHQGFKPQSSRVYSDNVNARVAVYNCKNENNVNLYNNQSTSSQKHNTYSPNNSLPLRFGPSIESKVKTRKVASDAKVFNFGGNESSEVIKNCTSRREAQIGNMKDAEVQTFADAGSEHQGMSPSGDLLSSLCEESADKLAINRGLNSSSNDVTTDGSGKAVICLSTIPCKRCSLTFETFQDLIQHMSSAHGIVISKCSKCGQIFYNTDDVKKHLLIHKPIVPLGPRTGVRKAGKCLHRCQICWKEFQSVYELRSHMMSHPHPYVFTSESLLNPQRSNAMEQRDATRAVGDTPAIVDAAATVDTDGIVDTPAIVDAAAAVDTDGIVDTPAIVDTAAAVDTDGIVDTPAIVDAAAAVDTDGIVDTPATVDAAAVVGSSDTAAIDTAAATVNEAAIEEICDSASVKSDVSNNSNQSRTSLSDKLIQGRTRKVKRKRKKFKVMCNKVKKKCVALNADWLASTDNTDLSDSSNRCRAKDAKGHSKLSKARNSQIKLREKLVGPSNSKERSVMKLKLRSNRNKEM